MPRPDVIISDIMMDDTDGFQLLSSLKEREGFNNIPFIFLTALGEEKEKLKGLDLGAIDFIEKPFSITALRAKIEAIIALRSRQEQHDREYMKNKIAGLFSDPDAVVGESMNSKIERACKNYGIAGREVDIVKMLARRLANKEIASLMNLSQRTVEYHITKIFKKCGVNNKYELLDKFQV
jgi:DNA-binding NarL/FixJ family response regulator